MKCHYIYEKLKGKVLKILIPGCWGSAVYGVHRCTCRRNRKPKESKETKLIKELEKENARLNRLLKKLLNSEINGKNNRKRGVINDPKK